MMNMFRFMSGESVLIAMGNVRAHKFRSFLTVLGIVIGVMTVIVVASLLTGMRSNIVGLIEQYGTSNIFAFHLSTGPGIGTRDRRELTRKPLRPIDGEAIRAQSSAVEDVANIGYVRRIDRTINYQGATYKQAYLQGVSPSYAKVANIYLHEGRFINEIDDQHRREVMVIGVNLVEALFPNENQIVGKLVELAGNTFEIIGVLGQRKSGFFIENEEDNVVFIPYRTARKLSPEDESLMLLIEAKTGRLREALSQTEEILRRQRGVRFNEPNNFDLKTAEKFAEQFDNITRTVGLVAIAISGIALLVGGIGVMNIMLVTVTERAREIGIRKAVGARRIDIIGQFLFEAMMLTSLGGVLGVVFAIVASYIIMFLIPELPASIPLWAVIQGVGVSTVIGLIFGVWPARKASRLDPTECLRYE
ncbi:MAG: ABC transporter permease [Acidobacteria bacterium]|nr:ABC transporter permease [Acidobacteriota bacterium]